uniref:Glutaredoxin domain-containing protein n=1 Tax=Kalanchoe fedtschenkoi TaxID=63787 RepID=A0A7N0VGM3_KALFE
MSRRMGCGMGLLATFVICVSFAIHAFTLAEAASASSRKPAKFVSKTIKSHDIVIFSKSYCPYCKRAKAVFKELNQKPFVVELDEREDGHTIQEALSEKVGRRTVPQVFIHGKHIGGSDDTIDAYESGELAKLLGIASQAKEDL